MPQPNLTAAAAELRVTYPDWSVHSSGSEAHLILWRTAAVVAISVHVQPTIHGCEAAVCTIPCDGAGLPVGGEVTLVRSTWEGAVDSYGLWLGSLMESADAALEMWAACSGELI